MGGLLFSSLFTVDGAEGGTGAAPIDFSNSVGMPFEEGLVCIIGASKIITAFDILRAMCLGADLWRSARGMMLALGCTQAPHRPLPRRCHDVRTSAPSRTRRSAS